MIYENIQVYIARVCENGKVNASSQMCFERLSKIVCYTCSLCFENFRITDLNEGSAPPENIAGPAFLISPLACDLDPDTIYKAYEAFSAGKNAVIRSYTPEGMPLAAFCRETVPSGVGGLEEVCAGSDHLNIYSQTSPITDAVLLRHHEEALKDKIIDRLTMAGVRFLTTDGSLISPFVSIGEGTVIYPGTLLHSGTIIGKNCTLGPNTLISNSKVGFGCVINATQIYDSTLEDNVKIGPFCHVRPNSYICAGVKIGDFVEVKNSRVGRDTHASHLTYIGDSDVGERVNFGCGTVTVNYDGYSKARTTIEDDAFIGCNTNLVAPVKIGMRAYTAAGSTITKDVPADALGISRVREQTNIERWAAIKKNAAKNNSGQ